MSQKRIHAFGKSLIIFFLIIILLSGTASAQFVKGFSIGWGLKTTEIVGNNPATLPFEESDPNKPPAFGGGFIGPQQGMELLFEFPIGTNNDFTLPLGIDYIFFQGLQHIPQTYYMIQDLENVVDVKSLSLGLNYALVKYKVANAKIYVGLEAKTSFIGKNEFTIITNYHQLDSVDISKSSEKESCVRLGGSIKLGLEGEIGDNWFVNIHGTFGVLNLIGRNDSRGELLTPLKNYFIMEEIRESYLYTLQYSFIIQYRL
ncbi:MAG: hypothetical protein EPN82_06815 [Bacteroidetes bacterium]|nr:MAG: hypothetical protein EPN82_06815 [Bacteroidota bacterium]